VGTRPMGPGPYRLGTHWVVPNFADGYPGPGGDPFIISIIISINYIMRYITY